MTLASGTRLGAFEVVAPLGAGCMGEVYRARDSRLNREVAIKILPDQFAADPDRLSSTSCGASRPQENEILSLELAGYVEEMLKK